DSDLGKEVHGRPGIGEDTEAEGAGMLGEEPARIGLGHADDEDPAGLSRRLGRARRRSTGGESPDARRDDADPAHPRTVRPPEDGDGQASPISGATSCNPSIPSSMNWSSSRPISVQAWISA